MSANKPNSTVLYFLFSIVRQFTPGIFILCLFAPLFGHAESYFGEMKQEANFEFDSYIFFDSLNSETTESEATEEIRKISQYISGHASYTGAAYRNLNVKILEIKTGSKGYIKYKLSAIGVFDTKKIEHKFTVPILAKYLFDKLESQCTPINHVEIGEGHPFWYSWDTGRCKLEENIHFVRISAKLSFLKKSDKFYPKYNELMRENSVKISLLFGPSKNKISSDLGSDENGSNYLATREYLKRKGFQVRTVSQKIKSNTNEPLVEEAILHTKSGEMKIRLFYGVTDFLKPESKYFHYVLKDALENDSVVIYIGHSGLGQNLNLEAMQNRHQFNLVKNEKYQIYFLNSCISYGYYLESLYNYTQPATSRLKHLDIFSYSAPSPFVLASLSLVSSIQKYMEDSIETSYQDILGQRPSNYLGVVAF